MHQNLMCVTRTWENDQAVCFSKEVRFPEVVCCFIDLSVCWIRGQAAIDGTLWDCTSRM